MSDWTYDLSSLVGKVIKEANITSEGGPDIVHLIFTDGAEAKIESSEWITGLIVDKEN